MFMYLFLTQVFTTELQYNKGAPVDEGGTPRTEDRRTMLFYILLRGRPGLGCITVLQSLHIFRNKLWKLSSSSVLKLFHELESLEGLLKHRLLGPSPRTSDSVCVK